MCKSISEGGQRCAAHTRDGYRSTPATDPQFERAAIDYASTPTGQDEVQRDADAAEVAGDYGRAARLRCLARRGQAMRAANGDTAASIRAANQDAAVAAATRALEAEGATVTSDPYRDVNEYAFTGASMDRVIVAYLPDGGGQPGVAALPADYYLENEADDLRDYDFAAVLPARATPADVDRIRGLLTA